MEKRKDKRSNDGHYRFLTYPLFATTPHSDTVSGQLQVIADRFESCS